jgi:hypothetical protein
MYLDKFVHSSTGKYIMSMLLGIGLATFFRAMCKGDNCVIKHAPPLEEIEDKIYRFDKKCYNYEKNAMQCDTKKYEVFKFQ